MGGVVEDAEEALQAVPADNPASRVLDGGGGVGRGGGNAFPAAPSVAPYARTSRLGNPVPSDPAGQGSSQAAPTPDAAAREALARRQAQERSDTIMSLMGVLFLLALVVAAGFYSKRAGRED
jgi:hypothetical protein